MSVASHPVRAAGHPRRLPSLPAAEVVQVAVGVVGFPLAVMAVTWSGTDDGGVAAVFWCAVAFLVVGAAIVTVLAAPIHRHRPPRAGPRRGGGARLSR